MDTKKYKKLFLENGSKVVIVGGGPAGSFFANFALHMAREKGIEIKVIILDRRSFAMSGQSGCNMCAGVISESLLAKLDAENIILPDSRVQNVIGGYYFQTQDFGLQLYHPLKSHNPRIVTVFRGSGPICQMQQENISFDDFLLQHAEGHGAEVIHATVEEIDLSHHFGDPINLVFVENGIRKSIQADLIVGAFGLNTAIVKRIVGPGFKYHAPSSVRTCNVELHLGRAYIEEHFKNNIYCFSLGIEPIKFVAFTPKGDYITVSLIGKTDITKAHLVRLLKHPVVKELLPKNWKIPQNICICFPKIPVTHAKYPFADRMVIIGDASISRFYKSGIESAFITARYAAKTVFKYGIAEDDFKRYYYKNIKRLLARDNFYGHTIYKINDFVASRRHLMAPYLRYAETKKGTWTASRINEILWGIVTGNLPYKKIFYKLASPRFQIMLLPVTAVAVIKSLIYSIKTFPQYNRSKKLQLLASKGLGQLGNGDTVAIIGGGPAGSSCAISLLTRAKQLGINLNVVLYEWKSFDEASHNECAGVLSPPIKEIIENELTIPFPDHLVESHINGYYLHSDNEVIKLDGGDEVSYGVLRPKFDKYLLEMAQEAGAKVIKGRVTDVEIGLHKVTVYSNTIHTRAEVVVGAFGLEEDSGTILERETSYSTPRHLLTILTKFHPDEDGLNDLEKARDYIHAFLPAYKDIEFGAITPKGDHYTINIAGAKIHSHSIERFLRLKNVLDVLPQNFSDSVKDLDFHRGCFPISPAKHPFGNRYVVIGDAAGLIRPFKGKGVNAALLMGIKVAEVMINVGISKEAFKEYYKHFSEVVKDLPYARLVRRLAISSANRRFLTPIIRLAKEDETLKNALFDSVSGRKPYRTIVYNTISLSLLIRLVKTFFLWLFSKNHLKME